MLQQHVLVTCMYPLHFRVCTQHVPMCEQHMILWQQHVAAAYLCAMTLRVRESSNPASNRSRFLALGFRNQASYVKLFRKHTTQPRKASVAF